MSSQLGYLLVAEEADVVICKLDCEYVFLSKEEESAKTCEHLDVFAVSSCSVWGESCPPITPKPDLLLS